MQVMTTLKHFPGRLEKQMIHLQKVGEACSSVTELFPRVCKALGLTFNHAKSKNHTEQRKTEKM